MRALSKSTRLELNEGNMLFIISLSQQVGSNLAWKWVILIDLVRRIRLA